MTTPKDDLGLGAFAASFERAANQLAGTLTQFKADAKRAQFTQRLLIFTVVLDLIVTITMGIVVGVSLSSNSTISLIRSCTNTNGKCYKQEQAQSVKVLGDLVNEIEAVAVCGFQHPKAALPEIAACVKKTVVNLK